jgi:hypothetical protein
MASTMHNDGDDDIGSIEASPLVITNMIGGNETKNDLIADLLGIPTDDNNHRNNQIHSIEEEEHITESSYLDNDIVPNPNADSVDLSLLRGVGEMKQHAQKPNSDNDGYHHIASASAGVDVKSNSHPMAGTNSDDTDLENLAELVPDIKTRTLQQLNAGTSGGGGMDMINHNHNIKKSAANSTKVIVVDNDQPQVELVNAGITTTAATGMMTTDYHKRHVADAAAAKMATTPQSMKTVASNHNNATPSADYYFMNKNHDSMNMNPNNHDSMDWSRNKKNELDLSNSYKNRVVASPGSNAEHSNDEYADSEHALEDSTQNHHHIHNTGSGGGGGESKVPNEFMNIGSSANSISTATQTHEVRMPMYLPTFKPATGCTNASDFIVRCFVARLRSGITVVKHGRSRWCKSRLRVLHIHPDGRSLSWKPAEGEPSSSKRPPKLDLSTCLEVRHAWSPDPQNPMYTGTPILRQKCEAANAHKSFALIFKQRTVDITAVTADQCKVLMEGFSALCFRLQVANLAGRNNNANPNSKKNGGTTAQHARPMPEEDGVSTTASATLTNTSIPKVRQ